eukprot:scaffold11352_cov72-Skeletonema_dohrnii-CCMP3373.AAC.3
MQAQSSSRLIEKGGHAFLNDIPSLVIGPNHRFFSDGRISSFFFSVHEQRSTQAKAKHTMIDVHIPRVLRQMTAADDEEDIAALIYQESQRRKKEAAEAAPAVDVRWEVTTKRTRQSGTEEEEDAVQKKLLESNTDVSVLLTDAQAPPTREEYVKGMMQNVNNQRSSDAAAKGAQIKLDRKECAGGMEQRRSFAALKDAQINLIQEECVGDMGRSRRGSFAVVKDAQIKLDGKEECATGMGQRKNYAVVKD